MKEVYLKENFEKIIKESRCISDVIRTLGIKNYGSNPKTIKGYIQKYNLDISHFNPDQVRIEKLNKHTIFITKPLSEILVENSSYDRSTLKKRLYKEGLKERICEFCGQGENWYGKKISLILDHINGISNDNRIENLRILCPNCNATLDTHCGKNNSKLKTQERLHGQHKHECLSDKFINNQLKKRKTPRPPYEQLKMEIEEMGYSAVGRKYKVSDNAIRKWCKVYEKHGI